MAETSVVINASEILRVMNDYVPRDRSGNSSEGFQMLSDLIRYMMGDNTPSTPILEELKQQLATVQAGLRELTIWRQSVMATLEQYDAALTKIESATTDIGNRIKDLEDSIKNMGLTAEQEDTLLTRLSGLGDSLVAMGKKPENPVPVPVPIPPEVPPTEPPAGGEVNPNQPSAAG